MIEDEPFLRAILANPDDRVSRLVYADWLDERADPRAEFLRIEARLAELPRDDMTYPELRQPDRRLQLQSVLPRWWLVAIGGLRATPAEPDPVRAEVAALALGRPVRYTDNRGYEITIGAAALCPRTGAVAYLESRSKWNGGSHDITYTLRLRDFAGHATSWELETYNPYFGCDTRFMEWYGSAVVFIYREKRHTYVARVGFDKRPYYCVLEDEWVLNGREIGFRGWQETTVRRLSVPGLQPFSTLSTAEAGERDLLPTSRWG